MTYADYEYYENTYNGTLSSGLFSSLIVKASKEIDRNVNIELTEEIIDELTEAEQDNLQYVACELCDLINVQNTSGVSSISIDGVSKTYKTQEELTKNKKNILDNLPQSLTRYI